MRYYLIAGESSGDKHAAALIKEIKQQDTNAEFRGLGGDLMQNEGMELLEHIRNYSVMGFSKVIKSLPRILKLLKACKQDLLSYKPDQLILIDFPGFNLKISEFAFGHQIPVHYFILPKIWAWKASRIKKIMKFTTNRFSILPFEEKYYKDNGGEVEYVGNPSWQEIRQQDVLSENEFLAKYKLNEQPIIALLPGSREQEIKRMLPLMSKLAIHFKDHQFIVAKAPNLGLKTYQKYLHSENIKMIDDDYHALLKYSKVGLITSGTATLEAALHNLPHVVCYKTDWLTYQLAKRFVNVKFISLVNIILRKQVTKELIQGELNVNNMISELDLLLHDDSFQKDEFIRLSKELGDKDPFKTITEKLIK